VVKRKKEKDDLSACAEPLPARGEFGGLTALAMLSTITNSYALELRVNFGLWILL